MKYLFPVLVTALFGMALTPAAEIKQISKSPEQVDTVKTQSAAPVRSSNEQILDQEDKQEQVEMEESDQINEFGNGPYMDNGNGTTTNRRINWPEP